MSIEWGEKSLSDLTGAEAIMALGRIAEALTHLQTSEIETLDHGDVRSNVIAQQAQEFAEAARQFHRGAISLHDCRPALRQAADERRDETRQVTDAPQKTPAEEAAEYAAACRAHHHK